MGGMSVHSDEASPVRRWPRVRSQRVLLAVIVAPSSVRTATTVAATAVALAVTGWAGARLGGASPMRGAARVVIWGIAAMALTMAVGQVVGTAV